MNNTPKLRFKEFSHDWNLQKLGQLGESIIGLTYSPDNIAEEGTLVLRSSNIKDNKIVYLDNVYVNMDIPDKLITIENDVLICSRNGSRALIGKSALIGKDNINNSFGAFMTLFRSDYGAFIFQLIQTTAFFKQIHQNLGATINQITSKDLNNMKFYVPKNEEKEKIASFFSLIDKKIELQTEKVEELKNYKKGIMQKIFSQELRFKDENGNEYPEWKIGRLGEYLSNKGGTALEKYVEDEGTHNFISIGNYSVDGNYIDTGQRINLNDKTQEKLLNKNDLVMVLNDKTASGDLIGSTILIDEDNKYIYNQRSERLICNSAISPDFCWVLLNSKMFRRKVFSIAQGGTQIYVNFSSVKNLEIELPHLKEQEKIAHFIFNLNTKLNKEQEKLDMLLTYKKGLLQQMFI